MQEEKNASKIQNTIFIVKINMNINKWNKKIINLRLLKHNECFFVKLNFKML